MGSEETNLRDFKLQPMKCELNYLSKADGSAILSQGDTVALVSVNGPLDIKMQSQSIEKATLEVLFSSKEGRTSVGDRYKENAIKQTCETAILGSLYPRTGITVTVQELEDFGGLVACCVNCACLALLQAGVGLRHVFAAAWCVVDARGDVHLAPARAQVAAASATMTFVFDARERNLVAGFTEGSFSEATYTEAVARCRAASGLVLAFYRDVVARYGDVLG